jgi:hypothetical protein
MTKRTAADQASRQHKEDLILRAYNYNDKARAMASCNAVYMGGGAMTSLWHALGADWPKISIFNAMSNATDEQLDAALVVCRPILDVIGKKLAQPTDNEPHSVQKDWDMLEARSTEATELKPDTTLRTKDGRVMGNAIAIRWETTDRMLVETDFGNRLKLTVLEIQSYFHLGFHQPYHEWAQARLEKIQNLEPL